MFWEKLNYPIVGLSPMDGVTDAPMRYITKKYGQADIIYTEFVSAEGLWRIKKRGETENKIWKDLAYDQTERPIIAQLFGSDPDSFYEAAQILVDMGFDGIDINMGCPSPGLERRGGGAGLMKDQGLAKAVIEATRKGAGGLPVSVKTRIGSASPDESWWKFLAKQQLPTVAMHGRTFKQLYRGMADWDCLVRASEIIRESGARFLGNGDIKKYSTFGDHFAKMMDGVLIGRAAIGNPWALRKDEYEPTVREKLTVAIEHARKYEEIFNKNYGEEGYQFFPMRKHLAWYAHGFPGANSLRRRLVVSNSADEVGGIINDFLDVSLN